MVGGEALSKHGPLWCRASNPEAPEAEMSSLLIGTLGPPSIVCIIRSLKSMLAPQGVDLRPRNQGEPCIGFRSMFHNYMGGASRGWDCTNANLAFCISAFDSPALRACFMVAVRYGSRLWGPGCISRIGIMPYLRGSSSSRAHLTGTSHSKGCSHVPMGKELSQKPSQNLSQKLYLDSRHT